MERDRSVDWLVGEAERSALLDQPALSYFYQSSFLTQIARTLSQKRSSALSHRHKALTLRMEGEARVTIHCFYSCTVPAESNRSGA